VLLQAALKQAQRAMESEQADAALRIQAIYRGRKERQGAAGKKIAENKEMSDAARKIQATRRGQQQRREDREQAAAATKMQANQRGRQSRRGAAERQEQEAAALKIQARLRGNNARDPEKQSLQNRQFKQSDEDQAIGKSAGPFLFAIRLISVKLRLFCSSGLCSSPEFAKFFADSPSCCG